MDARRENRSGYQEKVFVLCSAFTFVLGILGAAGWIARHLVLASFRSKYIPMAPLTSVSFIILSSLLFLLVYPSIHKGWKRVGFVFALLVALVQCVKLIEFFTPIHSQIERISPITSVNLLLLSLVLAYLFFRTRDQQVIDDTSGVLTFITFFTGFCVILGYAYGTPLLYGGKMIPVALTTGIAIFLLSIGLIAAVVPYSFPFRLLFESSTRSLLLRSFIPYMLMIVVTVNLFFQFVVSHWIANSALGESLRIIFILLVISASVWQIAKMASVRIDQKESDRQKAMEVFKNVDRQKKLILEHAGEGIVGLDLHGNLTFVNEAATRMIGWTVDELLGKSAHTTIHHSKADGSPYPKHQSPIFATLRDGETHHVSDDVFWNKNGTSFPVEYTSAPIWEQGKVAGAVVVFNDSTERKQTEEALLASERRARLIIDTARYAFISVGKNGRIIDWNPQAEVIFGWSSQEAVGKLFANIVFPERFHDEYSIDRLLTVQEDPLAKKHLELVALNRYQQEFSIEMTISSAGHRLNQIYNIFIRDITERKQVEEKLKEAQKAAELAVRAKSEFLAMMSHEIRTPMNGVIGTTDLLQRTPLTAEQQAFVKTIRTSGETLLTLINSILDFSKFESDKIELERVPLDIRNCIEEAFDNCSPTALQKGIDLFYHVDSDIPIILGDATRLRQILVNLINNGLKFTEEGEIVVWVKKQPAQNDSLTLCFEVKDTGIGIPANRVDRLFKAFSQVDSSTTRKYGGTGLGLAICAKLVEIMKGKIWVTSKEREGSSFFFTIQAEAAPATNASSAEEAVSTLRYKSVLIVHENPTAAQILAQFCLEQSMMVRSTNSGREALDCIRGKESFDVGILDAQVGTLSGSELASEIRKIYGKKSFPMLLIVDREMKESNASQLDALFSGFLSKPIKQSQLHEVLTVALSGKKLSLQRSERTIVQEKNAIALPSIRILVAEDNPTNQQIVLMMLESLGCSAVVVGSGTEVLEILKQQSFDIIFMDVQMPQMDGFEATRIIRNNSVIHPQPTIIAMTANAMHGDREKCLEAGMNDYISKPITIDRLGIVLEHWGQKVSGSANASIDTNPVTPDELVNVKQFDAMREPFKRLPPGRFEEIMELFFNSSSRLLKLVQTSIENQDFELLEKAAHNLRGSSLNVGGAKIASFCLELEKNGRQKDMASLVSLVHDLETAYLETVAIFKELTA